ncbi:MAG: hypothetical protein ABGY95_01185 [Rubritalea sp.]|uniref:hypothetical protein n=1 Tax=Rubritalea sp. TaxID=2109375 RepID=UPI003242453C
MKPFLLTLSIVTLCACTTYAASYLEPNLDGKILVKVDQVPLDANTMRWMASYMAQLAEQQASTNDAKKLQASAKLIALASQFDQSLTHITMANLKLKGGVSNKSNIKDAEHQRRRLLDILEYLVADKSTAEGKLLAQLTKDALAPIAPEKSSLSLYSAPKNLWKDSIADYDKFKKIAVPVLANNDQATHSEVQSLPTPKVDKTPHILEVKKTTSVTKWKITDLIVKAPITSYKIVGEYSRHVYSTGLKKMAINITPLPVVEGQTSKFHSKPFHHSDYLSYFTWQVLEPLHSQWQNIPPAQFNFQLSDAYSHNSDKDLTCSALTIAFDSALLGTSLKNNLLVVSAIDNEAKFQRNKMFWRTLSILTKEAHDTRILVGQGSEEYLLQLIALGYPDFFIQNEVIEVKNLSQSRKLTSTEDHEDYAEATALFAEIKSAIERKSLRSMTENKYVREKLERILVSMPNHLSAKILLEYGSRKKPSTLDSKFFAIDMKHLLMPIDMKLRINGSSIDEEDAMDQSTKISERLAVIQPIISEENKIIYDKVRKISATLRSFSKAKKSIGDRNTSFFINTAKRSLRELKSLNNEVQFELARLTGVPLKELEE